MLLVKRDDGPAGFWSFDLERNVLGKAIQLELPFASTNPGPYFEDLQVHPSDNRALIGFRSTEGNQVSLASVDLSTGRLSVLRDSHVDSARQYARINRSWRWLASPQSRKLVLHPDLNNGSFPVLKPPVKNESIALDAHDVAAVLFNAFSEQFEDMPEGLRAYEAHRLFADPPSATFTSWVGTHARNLRESANGLASKLPADRGKWPSWAHGLTVFADALNLVHEDRSSEVDWTAVNTSTTRSS
jgi:hypothetical protein